MKKNKKENIIKRWYKLAEPSKSVLAMQILSYSFYAVFYTITSYFAAFTINSLYEGDWKMAYIYLAIEFLLILLRNVALHLEFKFYGDNHVIVRCNVAKKIYQKILKCERKSSTSFSKEKIISTTVNNMEYIGEFADTIAVFCSDIIQFAVMFFIMISLNVWAGLIVTIVGIINFFALNFLNKKLRQSTAMRHEEKDNVLISYNKIIDGRDIITELKANETYEEQITKSVEKYAKAYADYYKFYSYREYVYFAIWNVMIYLATAVMIYFVSDGTLGMEAYLVIVPYLSNSITRLNKVYNSAENFGKMKVDVERVSLILNLTDKELIQYGKINDAPGYNLGLIEVNYRNDDKTSAFYGNLINADISFMMNKINVIKGKRGSGKRIIFNLLRRYIKPDKGIILLDNLNLFDYEENNFKKNINYCSSHPTFIKGSIKENLLVTKCSFAKIKDMCKKVGVYETIESLPESFDTDISKITSSSTNFLIGLVRAALSDCKVLMIYEIPEDAPAHFRNNIKQLIKNNETNKTIILFTHSNSYNDIYDIMYCIEDGKIIDVKVKNSNLINTNKEIPHKTNLIKTNKKRKTETSSSKKALLKS